MKVLIFLMIIGVACSDGDAAKESSKESDSEEATGSATDENLSIAIVPKSLGNPYFSATEVGAKRAGEDLGIDVSYVGSTESDAASQVNVLEDLINKKVDRKNTRLNS